VLSKVRQAASLAVLATVGTAVLQLAGTTSAQASPGVGTPTVVSLGDSFIAGEGGRLAGQADNPATDLGWGVYHDTVNYGLILEGGCHRSDSAPVFGVPANMHAINIACSGAQAPNVWRSANGGQSYKFEPPQADQLLSIAQNNNVTAVVLSIGGNDLGFGDVVSDCVWNYLNALSPCLNTWDLRSRQRIDDMMTKVSHAIFDIRTTMSLAGYNNSQWGLIVESYPSPIADKANLRSTNYGCPIYGDDADWVNKVLIPRLAGAIRQVVRLSNIGSFNNAQFLDLSAALRGHEVCNKNAQFSWTTQPPQAFAEWANWINFTSGTNRKNESIHPNFFGQKALQQCLAQMLNQPTGNFRCAAAGAGQIGVGLQPLGPIWSSFGSAQVVQGDQSILPGTCINAVNNSGRLCFQTDGNLVNYRGSTAVWNSGTFMTGMTCVFARDGNIVIKNASGQVVFHSDSWGNPDAELVVNDSGWVNILNPGGNAVWMSGTTGGGSSGGSGGSTGPPRHEN
jgi:hypothetical protein